MRRLGLMTGWAVAAICAAAVAAPAPPELDPGGGPARDQCTVCHRDLPDERLSSPALLATNDIHHSEGIGCAGCHGGDPLAGDPEAAMDEKKGFVGSFAPQDIPDLCGRCHSDPRIMLPYSPNIPTDQREQYRTSKHGQALARGDARVAVCTSCHGSHGVLPAKDARSPVYPTKVVATCARCHADRALMAERGITTNPIAEYQSSVHYAALVKKNDLSAPTCNTCHGAHGATPPGHSSVSDVCGSCHSTQREGFEASPHRDAFQASGAPACEGCHGNHAIVAPSDRWLGLGEGTSCGQCHTEGDRGAEAAKALGDALSEAAARLESARARVDATARAGMLMDPAEVKLDEANQALVVARVQVHTVDPAVVKKSTDQALAACAEAEKITAAGESEIRYRRGGLFVALAIIGLAVVALIAKLRQIES